MIRRLTPLFLPLAFALAQEEELEPIEVRGIVAPTTGTETTVFDREAIEAFPDLHLDDLLSSHPSFSTYRRSGSGIAHPTIQGVSLRGTGTSAASRSIVLLDGIPLNDPFGGWVRWNRFSPAELEAVRFKPPSAFASSSGTITLKSRRPTDKPIHDLRLVGGDVHGFSVHGFTATTASQEDWEAKVGFRMEDYAGHPVIRASQRGLVDEDAWSRMHSARTSISRNISVGRITLILAGFDEHRGNGTPLARNEGDGFDWSVRLETENFRTSIFGQERDFASVFPKVDENRTSESIALDQFTVPASSLGFIHEHSFDADEHEFGFALVALRREGHTNEDHYFSGTRRNAGGRQTQVGLSLTDAWSPAESWSLSADLKGEWFRNDEGIRKGWKTSNGSFPVREDLEVGGSLHLSKVFSETIVARASARSHVRQPTLNELYRDYRVGNFSVEGNANLATERITGIEFGLDWQVTERLSASLGLFHDHLQDSVTNVSNPEAENNATRHNLDNSSVRGLELSTKWFLTKELSLRLHGLLMDTEVGSCPENPGLVGNSFAQVPKRRATATLLWTPTPWELRLDAHHESERFDDARNTRRLDDFLTLDLAVTRNLSPNARLRLAVQNLADEEIQTRLSPEALVYVGEPRHWTVSCEWRF